MPAAAYSLGPWAPDLAASSDHLSVAQNVRAIANGYAPQKSFSAITPTLGAQFTGGGAFVQSSGTAHLLSATASSLRTYSGGSWSDAQTGLATTSRWYFTQFGDNIIYAHGGQLSSYAMSSGTGTAISGAPSNAIDCATVRDFVMCLTGDHQVVWSEFNDSSGWDAGENQSDTQPLLDGGAGVRIVGGEYALILQENCIRRVQYSGGDVVFQFDVISPEIGCMAGGSVAAKGRLVFFLAESGFQMCNGVEVTPIGDEQVNRDFFARFSREDIANIWAAIDPRAPVVKWGMPGTPGLLLCFNWVLKRWYTIKADLSGLFSGVTANTSIDVLDVSYPLGLDSIPVSLDDPMFQGGNPLLLVVNGDNEVGAFGGDNMEATVEIPAVEPTPGRRSRIRSIRPITDATTATVTVNARMRRGDSEAMVSANSLRTNGKAPIRCNGRYNDIRVVIPAGETWTDIQGVEVEFEAGDGR